ncbi:MAG: tetratricopeptide repeat protein, partial [Promethearchaeota archaeon]
MSHSELNQLKRAEQLFDAGKLDDAFELLNKFEKKQGLIIHDKIANYLLRINFLYQQGRYNEILVLAEETYNKSLRLEKSLFSIDALMWKASALINLNKLDEAYDIIYQGEEILKNFTQKVQTDFKQREALIAFVKSELYDKKGDANLALKYCEHSLVLREELGINHEIAYSLYKIVFLLCFYTGELDRALKYAKRSLAYAKKSTKKYYIAHSLIGLGGVYIYQGELDRGILLFEQSLVIFKELKNKRMIAISLNNLGDKYRMRGELDRALECLEQSLALQLELGNLRDIALTHDFLIQILIDKGDLKRVKIFFHNLEQLNNQLNDKTINLIYLFLKALLLKISLRAFNRVKAEEILNQILEEKDLSYEMTIRALLSLCELHLIELRMTDDLEVLDDINPLIVQLLEIADKSHSYWILSETYLLQAKLALLTFDIKKAQQHLSQAQKIAEYYGLKQLVMKISYEHDELLRQTKMWENLKNSEVSLSERLELSGLNDQMERMVKKRIIEIHELSDEESVHLLILSEGGIPLLSHSFIEGKSIESHLFSG